MAAILQCKKEQIANDPRYKDHMAMIGQLFSETIQNTILTDAQEQELLRQATLAAAAMPAEEPSKGAAASSVTAMDVDLEKREREMKEALDRQAEEAAANNLRKTA